MNRLPPRSTRTDTLFLYTTLFRSLQFLHVVTKKGQGYKLAEADPVLYHGPGKFDPSVGIQKPKEPPKQTFTKVFGRWLRSEEHTYELQSLMRISYAVFCLKKKKTPNTNMNVKLKAQNRKTII